MIKLKQTVIVEGKYDKITLENVIDANILTTDGFSIFKDERKRELIKKIALKNGIVILTDSDSAGNIIRAHIKNICKNGTVTNVYIPQLRGKEKRKAFSSKEGTLGVEGMTKEVLIEAFERSGISVDGQTDKITRKITKADFYNIGISGSANSSALRKSLAEFLELPDNLSSNAFLDAVNAIYEYDEFLKAVKLWRQEADKK